MFKLFRPLLTTAAMFCLALPLVFPKVVSGQYLSLLGSGGDFSTAGGTGFEMDSHSGNWLYISSQMGGGGNLIRINVSDPTAIGSATILSSSFTGGIAVNSITGRYATTNGFGGQLRVFNQDTTIYDTESIIGCGGSLIKGNGTFGISTQCNDRFHIYNEAAAAITFVGSGAVGSTCAYASLTGRFYHNRSGPTTFVNEFAPHSPGTLSGNEAIFGTNSVTGRLYGRNKINSNYLVLDAVTHANLLNVAGFPDQYWAVDEARNLLYTTEHSAGIINIRNPDTGSILNTFDLGGGWKAQRLEYDSATNLLFAMATNSSLPGGARVFAMRASSIPEPSSGILFGLTTLACCSVRGRRERKTL